jgi:uncharacterized membrane protein
MNSPSWNLDRIVGSILLSGMILAVILLSVSLVWQWVATGMFGTFPTIVATNLLGYLIDTFRYAIIGGMSPGVLASTGIAVLLLTPFASVFASVLFFGLREHNHVFTGITGFVLLVLAIVLFIV